MQNNGSYPNFGGFSQTLGVNAKILGFYTLGTHFSWGYPNFVDLPKMCYLDEEEEEYLDQATSKLAKKKQERLGRLLSSPGCLSVMLHLKF